MWIENAGIALTSVAGAMCVSIATTVVLSAVARVQARRRLLGPPLINLFE